MTIQLGCIADDFTGATDLAAMLARSGASVSLRMGIPDELPAHARTADFEVIALKCRTTPVDDAVAECRRAFEWLKSAGAVRFFWKYCSTFDSTDKGNIGPVAEALLAGLDSAQTIYCPSFPENGRQVFMGNLFVAGIPLHESPMKDHPLTPMRDANLERVLQPQVSNPTGLVSYNDVEQGADAVKGRLKALSGQGIMHCVVDAISDSDLQTVAEASYHLPLLTGGSAIASKLPDLYRREGDLQSAVDGENLPALAGGAIVLSGSCSAMTQQQVETYALEVPSYRIDPLLLQRDGIAPVIQWLETHSQAESLMIYSTAEPSEVEGYQQSLGVEEASAMIEAALADLAVLARDMGRCRFVVAGGETSGAVTKGLGVNRLRIGPEIAPGVPWTFCVSQGKEIALTLKSGNFGTKTFFKDSLALLT